MNLDEMKTYLRNILGDSTASLYNDDPTLVLFLNESAIAVSARSLSLLTFGDAATVIDDQRYPLPIDFLALKDIQIYDGALRYQLVKQSYDEFEEAYGATTAKARPIHYRVEFGATDKVPGSSPGDIWLGPIPNAVYPFCIAYYQRTSRLVDDDDDENSFELQEPFHRAVCFHAAMDLSLKHDDSSRANKMAALYQEAMDTAMRLKDRMDNTGPRYPERAYGTGRHDSRRRR